MSRRTPLSTIQPKRFKGLNVTAPDGAWGVLQVNGYTGPCMQIKRISDSATLDIGFTPEGIVDWQKADSFCGGSLNKYNINILYDQSGNANNLQTTSQSPIQWGNNLNNIRSLTINSGSVNQDLKNTSFPITEVRNTSCFWLGSFVEGNASAGIYEIGNPTDRFWVGTVTGTGGVDNSTLNKCIPYNPIVITRVGNGASNRVTTLNDFSFSLSASASNAATGVTLGNSLGATEPGRTENLIFLVYNSTLSAAAQTQITDQLYGVSLISRISSGDVVCMDGDSITLGTIESTNSYQKTWAYLLSRQIGRPMTFFDLGVSGKTAASGASGAAGISAKTFKSGKFNVAVIWYGTNDLGSNATAVTTYTNLQTIYAAYKTAGFNKIIGATILPRNAAFSGGQTAGGFEIARQALNALIVAGAGTDYDILADVGNDAVIGNVANCTTTYFFDLLHLTTLGQTIVLPYFVNTLLQIL